MLHDLMPKDEMFCIETVDSISNDLDSCSTTANNAYNKSNLTPNLLNKRASTSIDIPVNANVGPMQLHKTQLFLETNESCGLNRNAFCAETEIRMELEETEMIEMNKKRVEDWKKNNVE